MKTITIRTRDGSPIGEVELVRFANKGQTNHQVGARFGRHQRCFGVTAGGALYRTTTSGNWTLCREPRHIKEAREALAVG